MQICKQDGLNYQGLTSMGTALTTGLIYYNVSKSKKHKLIKSIGLSVLSGILTAGILQEVVCKNKYDLIEPTGAKILSVEAV